MKAGLKKSAGALLITALALGCGGARGKVRDGDDYMSRARYDAAARAYGEAVSRKPGWGDAQRKLAEALLGAGEPDRALIAAQEACRLETQGCEGPYVQALVEVGRAPEAHTLAQDALARGVEDRALRLAAADAALSTGDAHAASLLLMPLAADDPAVAASRAYALGRAGDVRGARDLALGVAGGSISAVSRTTAKYSYRELFQGVMEVPRHWWLALRTSVIGAVIGMIPGLGGSAAAWICYGHAVQSSKTPERFGHGAVEGVIAPETASNAKEGGSLLPTLFFGIPGSSGMAVMLGAFLILGIQPGPAMITQNMELVWMLIWALVVGNIMAVCLLLFIARWVAVLTFIRGALLIPFVLVLCVLGAFINEGHWQNLLILVVFSAIGYGLLRFGWPRAPFAIGLVLGGIAEKSLNTALALWGPAFFMRPLSLVLLGLIVMTIALAIYKARRAKKTGLPAAAYE